MGKPRPKGPSNLPMCVTECARARHSESWEVPDTRVRSYGGGHSALSLPLSPMSVPWRPPCSRKGLWIQEALRDGGPSSARPGTRAFLPGPARLTGPGGAEMLLGHLLHAGSGLSVPVGPLWKYTGRCAVQFTDEETEAASIPASDPGLS